MTEVFLSVEAEVDVLEITSFVSSGDEALVRKFVTRLTEVLDLLAEHPEMGRKRDDLRPGLRSVNFNPYIVIYQIQSTDVEVVRILHGARDIAALFREAEQ
jgi:toxin ParE1/3/4